MAIDLEIPNTVNVPRHYTQEDLQDDLIYAERGNTLRLCSK